MNARIRQFLDVVGALIFTALVYLGIRFVTASFIATHKTCSGSCPINWSAGLADLLKLFGG